LCTFYNRRVAGQASLTDRAGAPALRRPATPSWLIGHGPDRDFAASKPERLADFGQRLVLGSQLLASINGALHWSSARVAHEFAASTILMSGLVDHQYDLVVGQWAVAERPPLALRL
jgi:hypothetical protein